MHRDIADFRGITGIKADKHFFRLHRAFHDAVRSGKLRLLLKSCCVLNFPETGRAEQRKRS